jgi:predicted nucleotidyltransferase component of viral defense system
LDPNNPYFNQVRLLVEVLPVIARRTEFALKGGTAINLFFRDMPRLSVDIDLAYVPIQGREKSLSIIDRALIDIEAELGKGASGMAVRSNYSTDTGKRDKLTISRERAEIKVEVATVLRGSLFPPQMRSAGQRVQESFGPVEMPLLHFDEVFAGKICAALDRQHPRDLFDIHLLLQNEGVTDGMIKAFLVYLISSPRPMAELLDPSPMDLTRFFELEFRGMTETPISVEVLVEARSRLVATIHRKMTDADREFLIGLKKGTPEWERIPFANVDELPAVKWKLYNLNGMAKNKREKAVEKLIRVLTPGFRPRCSA